jgi:hypothetical protein
MADRYAPKPPAHTPPKPAHPIDRSAFLYFDPVGDRRHFAQCGTCRMFTGSTCTIHGPDLKVTAGDTCGLYVHGKPVPEEKGRERAAVTTEESGFERREVRCEHCVFYRDARCQLFIALNTALPTLFALNPRVSPYGCCNANVAARRA